MKVIVQEQRPTKILKINHGVMGHFLTPQLYYHLKKSPVVTAERAVRKKGKFVPKKAHFKSNVKRENKI